MAEAQCGTVTDFSQTGVTVTGEGTDIPPGGSLSVSYGNTLGGPYALGTSVSPYVIIDLTPGTTYYYVVEVRTGPDGDGDVVATSDECLFATLPYVPGDVVCRVPAREYFPYDPGEPIATPLAWPLLLTCCPAFSDIVDPTTEQTTLFNQMRAAAIDLLFTQTCSKYNVRCDYIYPCIPHTCCGGDDLWGAADCGLPCARKQLNLRDYISDNVLEVMSIEVNTGDGVVQIVPTTQYRLDGSKLVPYNDGTLLWPHWPKQNRNAPWASTTHPTWRALVRHGAEPPPSLLLAAGDLTCNLWNFCQNKPCDIPSNAVSVTKEGVTIQLETGLKAIPSVKMALDTYGNCKEEYKPRSRLVDPSTWVVQ